MADIADPVGFFFFHDGTNAGEHSLFCVVDKDWLLAPGSATTHDNEVVFALYFGEIVPGVTFGAVKTYLKKRRYEVVEIHAQPKQKTSAAGATKHHVARKGAAGGYVFAEETLPAGTEFRPYYARETVVAFLVGTLGKTKNAWFDDQFSFLDYLSCHRIPLPTKDGANAKFMLKGDFEPNLIYANNYMNRTPIALDDTKGERELIIYDIEFYNLWNAFMPKKGEEPIFLRGDEKFRTNEKEIRENFKFKPFERGFAFLSEIALFKGKFAQDLNQKIDNDTTDDFFKITSGQIQRINATGEPPLTDYKVKDSLISFDVLLSKISVLSFSDSSKNLGNDTLNSEQFFVFQLTPGQPNEHVQLYRNDHALDHEKLQFDTGKKMYLSMTPSSGLSSYVGSAENLDPEFLTCTPLELGARNTEPIRQYFFPDFVHPVIPPSTESEEERRPAVYTPKPDTVHSSATYAPPPATATGFSGDDVRMAPTSVGPSFGRRTTTMPSSSASGTADELEDRRRRDEVRRSAQLFEEDNGEHGEEDGGEVEYVDDDKDNADRDRLYGPRGIDDPYRRAGYLATPLSSAEAAVASAAEDGRGPFPSSSSSSSPAAAAAAAAAAASSGPSSSSAASSSSPSSSGEVRRASSRDIGHRLSMLLFYGVPFFVPLFFVFNSVVEQDFKGIVYLLGLMATLVLCYVSFLATELAASSWFNGVQGFWWFRGAPGGDTVSALVDYATRSGGTRRSSNANENMNTKYTNPPDAGPCVRIIVGSTDYAREMNVAMIVLAYTFMYLVSCAVFNNLYEDGFSDFPRYASLFTVFLVLALHNFVVSSSVPSCHTRAYGSDGDEMLGKFSTDLLSVVFGGLFGYVFATMVHSLGVPELTYYGPRGGGGGGGSCRRSEKGGNTVDCG